MTPSRTKPDGGSLAVLAAVCLAALILPLSFSGGAVATSIPHPEHKIWPYLLRDLPIDRPDHVWCKDITYIPMRTTDVEARCSPDNDQRLAQTSYRGYGRVIFRQGRGQPSC